MEFRILGSLEVEEDGRQLTPRRAKQRALLATLLLRANEVVATDQLIDALWGESPPETAPTALHGHVSALRKLLGAERIETEAPGYALRLEADELDLSRFEALLAEARATPDTAARSKLVHEALDLWRGDPLPELRYESFAQAQIARLEELHLAALEQRIDAELELGGHGDLLPELEELVRSHPLRERLREQLMLALYRSGRQADALHAYQDARRTLAEELGIDPGSALQTLERQILSHDPTLDSAREEAPSRQQARKIVTVLVAELSSRTPLDPEDIERVTEPALERARSTLEGFGATVEPLFSNALLAVFGAPRAHEDDAERAVRAGAAVCYEIAATTELEARVGVETGEALVTVVGDRVEITGDVLAAASRLQATAPANEVVVGERADAYRRAAQAGDPEAPFIGREHELALLERTFQRAVSENTVQLVTVAGEPGSGKTRLAKEFRRRLEQSHVWREGRCLPYGHGVTFWALGEVLKAQAGILESDEPGESARKLEAGVAELVSDEESRAWLRGSLAPLIGVESATGSTTREAAFAAWREFLEQIAWREPLIVVLEDLHWAGPELVEFVDDIITRGTGPILIFCTARLEFLDGHADWGGGKRNATAITLAPLSVEDTERLLAVLLGRTAEPSEVKRSGGNPLFAQELARMTAVAAESRGAVPESIHALIAARLDTLAPELREVASAAAVVGEVFWSGAVASIAEAERADVEERLHRLGVADVVRRVRTSSVRGQNEFAFLHVLVRDVAYNQIPKRGRAEKHEATAAWIERLAGERVTDHAELIAHHYGAALELAHAASEFETADLRAKACRFLVLAGDRAMQLDVSAAERFYRDALELFDEDGKERVRVLLALARTAQEAGRLEESLRLYEDAIPKLRTYKDPLELGRALVDYENAVSRLGKLEQRGKALAEAVELLERESPGPELADAYNFVAREYMVAGRPAECLMWSEKAIALATELRLERNVVRALQFRGVARASLNDLRGLDDLRESLRLGLQVGAGIETGLAFVNLGEWLFWTEGPEPCLELYEEGIEFSERHGLIHNAYWLRSDKLRRLFDLGRWDELLSVVDEVMAWERSRGETQITTVALVEKAGVLVRRGAVAEAKSLADAWLEPARAVEDPQVLAPALVCAALVEQASGDDLAAIQRLEELETTTRDLAPIWRALWLMDVVRVCVAANALELGKRLVDGLDVVAPRHVYAVLTARAVLAEAEGRLEDALCGYGEASARWREFGNVLEEGQALLGQARCLAALGRPQAEVKPSIDAAREIFAQLGAAPLIDEAERVRGTLLSRASGS